MLRSMGVGGIFSRVGPTVVFPGVTIKIFFQDAKSNEISFYPLETKKTTFFAKNVIENF